MADAKYGNWTVGLSTGCFYQESILDCLERIRNAGFSLIEVCSFPAHLDYHDADAVSTAAQKITALGLEPYSFHAPFADHIDITALDPSRRETARQEILQAAKAAAILGVRYLVIHPGPEKGGFPDSERFQRMGNAAQILNEMAVQCKKLNVGLVLENMLPHLFSGHVRDLMWILGALDTTEVGVCLDTGHAHLSGDLRTVAHKLSGHLWMVHASDNNGNFDDHLPPGDGQNAWPSLVKQLHQNGFNGTVILEIAGGRPANEVIEMAQRGRQFLRGLSYPAPGNSNGHPEQNPYENSLS